MTEGYCYFCDRPADDDPCPTCGKTLHRPEPQADLPRSPEREDAVVSGASDAPRTATATWLKWAVGIAALIVIALLLRAPFGI